MYPVGRQSFKKEKMFNKNISLFKPKQTIHGWVPGIKPEVIPLKVALLEDHQPELREQIRNASNKDERQELKKGLYAVTISAVMEGGRSNAHIQSLTNLMCIDFDKLPEGQTWQSLKEFISEIPYCLYVGFSISGQGLYCIFPIEDGTKHKSYFKAISLEFERFGIEIDKAVSAPNSLRYLSYDRDAIVNLSCKTWSKGFESDRVSKKHLKLNDSDRGGDAIQLIEWFNQNCRAQHMDDILTAAGFNYHSSKSEQYRYTRPGKDTKSGLSVDYDDNRRTLFVFSSEVPYTEYMKPSNGGWSCSPVTALLWLGCNGNWKNTFDYIKWIKKKH